MASQENPRVEFKIAPQESLSIIGSNSIDTAGDLYTIDVNSVNKPANRRKKRIIDISFSVISLILSPLLIFVVKQPLNFLANIFKVLFGFNTWVGYGEIQNSEFRIRSNSRKKGIIFPADVSLNGAAVNPEVAERINKIYAKDYSAVNDVKIILKGLRKLGA